MPFGLCCNSSIAGVRTVAPVNFVTSDGKVNLDNIRVELVDSQGRKVAEEVSVTLSLSLFLSNVKCKISSRNVCSFYRDD